MINMHRYNVTQHFATPLLHLNNLPLANQMLPVCRNILDDERYLTNKWDYKNTYTPGAGIEQLSEMEKFTIYVKSLAKQFLNDLGYDTTVIQFDPQVFTSQMNKGDSHGRHCHPGAILSGVFYLNMPDESSPIQFYDPRPWRDTRIMPVKKETEQNIPSFTFNPSAGDLIMWESWLHHEVIPNKSNDRVTLVFNL